MHTVRLTENKQFQKNIFGFNVNVCNTFTVLLYYVNDP